jgi:hypothetical protein
VDLNIGFDFVFAALGMEPYTNARQGSTLCYSPSPKFKVNGVLCVLSLRACGGHIVSTVFDLGAVWSARLVCVRLWAPFQHHREGVIPVALCASPHHHGYLSPTKHGRLPLIWLVVH